MSLSAHILKSFVPTVSQSTIDLWDKWLEENEVTNELQVKELIEAGIRCNIEQLTQNSEILPRKAKCSASNI